MRREKNMGDENLWNWWFVFCAATIVQLLMSKCCSFQREAYGSLKAFEHNENDSVQHQSLA